MNNQLLLTGSRVRIRLIALFEFVKGMLGLALGFGLLASLDESLVEAAQELVMGLHLDPARRLPDAFIDATSNVHRAQLGLVVASAVAYALVRFGEAYGLWRDRRWAAWVSALSGGIYLPIEAYELSKGLSWFRVSAAAANAAIVAYMALLLWRSRRSHIAE
jgi:uncharacterized membrane protein (DUF2068 family)